jgi:multiple sugar transport system permease protein
MSALDFNLVRPDYGRHLVIWGNYVKAFQDPSFLNALWLAVYLSVGTVTAQFVFGMVIALLLNRPMKGINLLQTVIIIPMVLTPVVAGLLWRYMYNPTVGIMNYLLISLGFAPSAWHGDASTALLSIGMVEVWKYTPVMTLIMLAGLQSLPTEPFEAAHLDGANRWQTFFYITLPLLRPIIVVALLIRIINSLQTFDSIMMLTRGGPGMSTQIFNVHLYKTIFLFFNIGYGTALSYIMLFITLVFCILFFHYTEGRRT